MNAISGTVLQMEPGTQDEAEAFIDQKANEISSIAGIINWGSIYTGENEVTVIAVYENRASAENATKFVNEVLADFAQFVTVPPVRDIYDARWN